MTGSRGLGGALGLGPGRPSRPRLPARERGQQLAGEIAGRHRGQARALAGTDDRTELLGDLADVLGDRGQRCVAAGPAPHPARAGRGDGRAAAGSTAKARRRPDPLPAVGTGRRVGGRRAGGGPAAVGRSDAGGDAGVGDRAGVVDLGHGAVVAGAVDPDRDVDILRIRLCDCYLRRRFTVILLRLGVILRLRGRGGLRRRRRRRSGLCGRCGGQRLGHDRLDLAILVRYHALRRVCAGAWRAFASSTPPGPGPSRRRRRATATCRRPARGRRRGGCGRPGGGRRESRPDGTRNCAQMARHSLHLRRCECDAAVRQLIERHLPLGRALARRLRRRRSRSRGCVQVGVIGPIKAVSQATVAPTGLSGARLRTLRGALGRLRDQLLPSWTDGQTVAIAQEARAT